MSWHYYLWFSKGSVPFILTGTMVFFSSSLRPSYFVSTSRKTNKELFCFKIPSNVGCISPSSIDTYWRTKLNTDMTRSAKFVQFWIRQVRIATSMSKLSCISLPPPVTELFLYELRNNSIYFLDVVTQFSGAVHRWSHYVFQSFNYIIAEPQKDGWIVESVTSANKFSDNTIHAVFQPWSRAAKVELLGSDEARKVLCGRTAIEIAWSGSPTGVRVCHRLRQSYNYLQILQQTLSSILWCKTYLESLCCAFICFICTWNLIEDLPVYELSGMNRGLSGLSL